MTIADLIDRLQAIVALDPRSTAIPVTFGPEMFPVDGGIVRRFKGRTALNLAPIPLDRVGGF